MAEDVVQLAVLGHLARVKWRSLAALAVVGALVGLAASVLLSPGFQSSSKVLLQDPRDEQAVLTETQIAVSLVVLDRTATGLGLGGSGADLVDRVSSEVVDGNIVRVTARGGSPEEAQRLGQRVTEEYVTFSTQVAADFVTAADEVRRDHRADVQARIDEADAQVTRLQQGANAPGADGAAARASIEQLRATIADSQRELDDIDGRVRGAAADSEIARASINIIEPAVLPTGRAAPTPGQLIGGGAVLFALIGSLALLVARRTDPRLRRSADIGASLGASLHCTVDVPASELVDPSGGVDRPRPPARLADRLLREDPQDVAERARQAGGREPSARYRRALARLRGTPGRPVRLLVLVPEDDRAARRAAAGLVLTAAAQGAGAVVITEDEPFTRLMSIASSADGPGVARLAVAGSMAGPPRPDRAFFRVVALPVGRPAVPDEPLATEVVVVVTAGTRTGWELVAVAEACADVDRRVAAAVVVAPWAAGLEPPTAPPQADPPATTLNGHEMAVSE